MVKTSTRVRSTKVPSYERGTPSTKVETARWLRFVGADDKKNTAASNRRGFFNDQGNLVNDQGNMVAVSNVTIPPARVKVGRRLAPTTAMSGNR